MKSIILQSFKEADKAKILDHNTLVNSDEQAWLHTITIEKGKITDSMFTENVK